MAYTVTPIFLCCVLRLLSWLGQSLFGEHYLREALSTHGAELRLPGLAGLKDGQCSSQAGWDGSKEAELGIGKPNWAPFGPVSFPERVMQIKAAKKCQDGWPDNQAPH